MKGGLHTQIELGAGKKSEKGDLLGMTGYTNTYRRWGGENVFVRLTHQMSGVVTGSPRTKFDQSIQCTQGDGWEY